MRLHNILLACALTLSACGGNSAKPDAAPTEQTDADYQEAMENEHAADSTDASGAEALASGTFETSGEMVEYGRLEEQPLNGYLAKPSSGEPRAAIILIHEWWGLNDNIKAMADKFASHGYLALAVDMYGGESASSPDQAKTLMTAAMENPEAGVQNLKLANAYLTSQSVERVGVVGWCFGGGWSLQAGITQPENLAAVVMYYGRVKTTKEEVAPLGPPLLGIFAGLDKGIPVENVRAFEAALTEAGKDAEVHVYDGVDHAFANPTGDRFSPEAAADAWTKTLAFFAEHLGQ